MTARDLSIVTLWAVTDRSYRAMFTANSKNFEKNSPNNSATTAR